MPTVRLSGTVSGRDDPRRKERAELLYHLFARGWDIYNGNGDQVIHLENIQKKIIESDAFVFTSSPTVEDFFNMTSIFVGFQTLDQDLKDKPAIIINNDKSWDNFLQLLDHLHKLGTVKEKYETHISVVSTSDAMIAILDDKIGHIDSHVQHKAAEEPDFIGAGSIQLNGKQIKQPDFNVCVFCSASIKKEEYLQEGYEVGKKMAEKGWGCISGAGKTGIMGSVVKGACDNGGWSGGSNVPHIIRLEGLPDGLNEFWPRGDIYTRMEVMIQKSDAFVIMPGGMGTVQELLALIILKHHKDDLMQGKKIIIYNKFDKDTKSKFWDPVIDIIKSHNSFGKEFEIVESVDDIFKRLEAKV